MPSLAPFLAVLDYIDPAEKPVAVPFRVLRAVAAVRAGAAVEDVSRDWRVKIDRLEPLIAADPIVELFGTTFADAHLHAKAAGARRSLGQMLLGRVAEQVFEAVRERRLYQITSASYDEAIRERMEALISRRNPEFPSLLDLSVRDRRK